MVKQMSGKAANATAPPKPPPTWRKRFQQNMKILNESSCRPCLRQSYIALLHQKQHLRALKQPGAGKKKFADVPPLVVIAPKTGRIGKKAQDAAAEAEKTTEKKRKSEAAYLKPPPASKRPKQPAGQDPTGSRAKETTPPRKSDKSKSRADKLGSSTGGPSNSRREPPKLGTSTTGGSNSRPDTPKASPTGSPATAISKSWPTNVKTQKFNGLVNERYDCYQNTAIQSLVCNPQFMNLLNAAHEPSCKTKDCLICALRNLANAYGRHSDDYKALEPYRRAMLRAIATMNTAKPKKAPFWPYSRKLQHDSREFLAFVLEHVQMSSGKYEDQFRTSFNIVHESSWTCHNCKTTHTTNTSANPGLIMPLQLVGKSLIDCLDDSHGNLQLEIRCDKCGNEDQRIRSTRILSGPDVLFFSFQRYAQRKIRGGWAEGKVMTLVNIPQTLDLSRWAVDRKKTEKLTYQLQAVAIHRGSGLSEGHYWSVVRNGKNWIRINDEDVTNASPGDIQGDARDKVTPYILTYVKVDSDS